ncbi:MAG: efflux RND transporter periplasmic adaptor subunit [Anaerostipes sp.]|jgi:HlyD family secretion protein|nr:efflux RND transporter periplasmic adaptor subunit [Anaerostipes sp.]
MPDKTKKVKNKRTILFKTTIIVATVILIIAYVAAYFSAKPTKTETVKTYTVKKADPYVFQGTVAAKRTKNVMIDSSKGKLKSTLVSDGEFIRKGQALLKYKNTSITSQIPTQEKVVTRTHRAYHNAYVAYLKIYNKKKKTDLDKQTLIGLKDTLDSTRDAYNDAVESLDDLKSHRTNYVRSTIGGYVSINQNAKDDNTLPYITITSNKIEVVGSVSEYDYSKLKPGATVTIEVISNNEKVNGTISKIDKVPISASSGEGSASSASTSSYNFYVTPEAEIQYGYSVEISLPVNEIRIPKKYIKKGSDSYYTYVYKQKKKIKTDVTVKEASDYYIVQSGLNVNDKVVIK